jgi:hypothetical protein
VLRLVLPAEPPALLKLSGVGADTFVGVHPTEPVLHLDDAGLQSGSRIGVETTEERALLDCAALRINSPAPYPPSRSPPFYKCPVSGLNRSKRPSPIRRLRSDSPQFVKSCLLKRACGD